MPGRHALVVLHPAGRIEVKVELEGEGAAATVTRAALVRSARKIIEGQLHLPDYVFSRPEGSRAKQASSRHSLRIIVPTRAGGGNDLGRPHEARAWKVSLRVRRGRY
ncbi:PrpF domain-containing protein, partial [Cupriavidus necator]